MDYTQFVALACCHSVLSTALTSFPILISTCSYVVHVPSSRATQSSDGQTLRWGVVRVRSSGSANVDFTLSYSDLCSTTGGDLNNSSCETIRAAGMLTLLTTLTSMVFAIILIYFLIKAKSSPVTLSQFAEKLYRFGGLTHTYVTAAFFLWMLGQQTLREVQREGRVVMELLIYSLSLCVYMCVYM
jgi:hypothetical protein